MGNQSEQLRQSTLAQVMEALQMPIGMKGKEAATAQTQMQTSMMPREMEVSERNAATSESNALISMLNAITEINNLPIDNAYKEALTKHYLRQVKESEINAKNKVSVKLPDGSVVDIDPNRYFETMMDAGSKSDEVAELNYLLNKQKNIDSKAKDLKEAEELILSNMDRDTVIPEIDAFNASSNKGYVYIYNPKTWGNNTQKVTLPKGLTAADVAATASSLGMTVAEYLSSKGWLK